MEKNLKKNIYIYKQNHVAVHRKLTQHYKSTILQFKGGGQVDRKMEVLSASIKLVP